ncbi:similar to ubiquitin carboxyl-terminal hydrolase 10 [Plenodomus lingam JN3]|uniref:Ubiquitin carboxyl-terminal hydrolase n=2 Tax=Leptosphaeria maculans TaxID=5022 RepID=E4ZU60_LEPMJ|nr:similar to ubiquitin carboxyl-terminal hydrolase 10 [Plenodomus lingam JN3]CBX94939.1 similar to ubiquitin carboxyl-terminal hydrolase 10 [Plenodomus lingam JN3]
MPGHIPPGRRQAEQYHHYQYPQAAHSPVHNPYAQYHYPQQYGPPHGYPQHMQHMQQQWYYQQPPPPPPPQQYVMPPRQFQPHASPVVVSSHLHMAPPVNRSMGQTPPIVHSHTPPVPRMQTPQPAPSTLSVHSHTQPSISTPPSNDTVATPPPPIIESKSATSVPSSPPSTSFKPFYPSLPWLSVPDTEFPARVSRRRRRRRAPVSTDEEGLALPSREQVVEEGEDREQDRDGTLTPTEEPAESQASTIAVQSDAEVETPSTSHPPSEVDLVHAAIASATPAPAQLAATVHATKHTRTTTKPAVPLIPIKSSKTPSAASTTQKSVKSPATTQPESASVDAAPLSEVNGTVEETPKASPPKSVAPKSWAELLRAKNAPAASQAPSPSNGIVATPVSGPTVAKSNTLADVLASFSVDANKKVAFIEPRGLVNTGNLCYMNSILQVLLFCAPFYDFLDQVAKRAAHSFKSETPLVDAMIMFMRDFKLIDSAASVDQLRLRLKDNELEQYGDPLTPEYVYDVIKRLPRFDNMKRGQQEDAEEFLGFLLAGLHDECAQLIKKDRQNQSQEPLASATGEQPGSGESGWHEVGPKQKTAVTQSSGTIEFETPITKIFGGKLRSEYKKPGEKPSVTLEPYQPLQLDIGEPHINNISDALKNLTRLETLDGAARGARASTKQVHIETLPPVLILHLKRFHYDEKGPQKIWKKIGYPLELELPKEVFAQHKRASFQKQGGFPRYRLTGVVYHHGKNASGGHYTVDLRRQEGKEWIRMDDTIIQRIRAEDVAEGGAEEDPKVLAAALEQHKNDAGKSKNFFAQIDMDEEETGKGAWSQVNGTEKQKDSTKKWTGVVNGTATPNSTGKRTPLPKENVRDNKVAYILFYQRIES